MIDSATVPAERCFWARLPPSKRPWTRERVLSAMEPWVPTVIDGLVVTWNVGRDGQVVAVACHPSLIDARMAEVGPCWLLTPSVIPEHVAVAGVAVESLDLLQGPRIPAQRQRFATALRWSALGIAVVAGVLAMVGAFRAQRQWRVVVEEVQQQVQASMGSLVPSSLSGRDADPASRLEHAQRLVGSLVKAVDGADGAAAMIYLAFTRDWPVQARVQIVNLVVDGNRCVCSGTAASVEDAQALAGHMAKSLGPLPGWRVLPLQASTEGGVVAFTLTAVRESTR